MSSRFDPDLRDIGRLPRQTAGVASDIVDADFVTISRSERRDFVNDTTAHPVEITPDTPSLSGMDALRRDRAEPPERGPGGPFFWAGGALLIAVAFWVSGGHTMFTGPKSGPTASTGLRVASVISRVDRSGIREVLQVDGKAVNDGSQLAPVPPLEIQVISTSGRSTLYKLGTAGRSLDAGDHFDFSSRLDVPKDGVRTVFVNFVN